jgi:hypothetical protein
MSTGLPSGVDQSLHDAGRTPGDVLVLIAAQRSTVAAAQAELDRLCLQFADLRGSDLENDLGPVGSRPPGAEKTQRFVAAELSLVLRARSADVSRLLARARRVRASLPTVAEAARRGELDASRVVRIDRAARLVVHAHTLAMLDDQVVAAAEHRTLEQLGSWLDRFLARYEPDQLAVRHSRSMSDRRVTMAQALNGMAYVTGEVAAVDGAEIDLRLSSLAQACGAADPRTMSQRRSDLFAGLLLGRISVSHPTTEPHSLSLPAAEDPRSLSHAEPAADLLEVEVIDPDTGEFLGSRWMKVDADGEPIETSHPPTDATWPVDPALKVECASGAPYTVGVVVTLDALRDASETPAELWDRTASVPAEVAREIAARPDTLFVRLLTDPAGWLLDVTELGRFPSDKLGFAVRARTATCAFPTCEMSASRCDLDHHEPVPRGPTRAENLGPLCRPHHNAKTFAGLACRRVADGYLWTDAHAFRYRCLDEPFPTEGSRHRAVPQPAQYD